MSKPIDPVTEGARLAAIAADSRYAEGPSVASIRYAAEVFRRFWTGSSCLELGPAEGVMTEVLAHRFPDLTVVEGAPTFCLELRRRHPGIEVVHALFEDFAPGRTYDTIVLGHVLEHVEDPVALAARARSWLAPGGRIVAAVPNSRSLHRQAAVLMGLLGAETDFSPLDVAHGHRRVFDPESFRSVFTRAGLRLHAFGGFWLKPVSNAQIADTWDAGMLAAFLALGERYPDIAAEIYAIAEHPDGAS